MSNRILIVEGGDRQQSSQLKKRMRRALGVFISKLLGRRCSWRIVFKGNRQSAFEAFLMELDHIRRNRPNSGDFVALLVDSDKKVPIPAQGFSPWNFVKGVVSTKKLTVPSNVSDEKIYLMVPFMEAWLVADRSGLERYFGIRIKAKGWPGPSDIEGKSKGDIYDLLEKATRGCKQGKQFDRKDGKRHTILALGELDPIAVVQLPWAERFVEMLKDKSK